MGQSSDCGVSWFLSTAMGRRYNNQVKYWEMWNEADIGTHFRGEIKTICEMTRIARDELKAINPGNQILSPNITVYGVEWLDDFLNQGGGQYVDVISWHNYPALEPELSLPGIVAVRDVMKRHGMQDKPLWNTEGKPGGNPGMGQQEDSEPANDDVARAAIARTHVIQWAYGIRTLCWYMWDEVDGSKAVKLSRSTRPSGRPDYAVLTPTGEAYNIVVGWLIGARMASKSVQPSSQGHRWVVEIARDAGYRGWIVWQTKGTESFAIPHDWRVRQIRRLDGSGPAAIEGEITLGSTPVLMENRITPVR